MVKDKGVGGKLKGWSWMGYTLVCFVLLIFAVALYADDWLEDTLRSVVRQKSKGVYALRLQDVRVGLRGGEITLAGVRLEPDFQRWQALPDSSQMPMLYRAQADRISIEGLSIWDLIISSPIRVRMLFMETPTVQAYRMKGNDDDKNKPLYEQLSGRLKRLTLDSLRINAGSFFFRSDYKNTYNDVALQGLNLRMQDLSLDSVAFVAEERVLYARRIRVNVDTTDFLLPKGLYRLRTGPIAVDTQTRSLEAKQVQLVPLFSPTGMAKSVGEVVSWMEGTAPLVQLQDIDFGAYVKKSGFMARSVTVQNPRLYTYTDLKHFTKKSDKELPHQWVQRLEHRLDVDTVEIKNLNVRYEELQLESDKKGYITFENTNITMTNLTNVPEVMSRKTPAVLRASTRVMGSTPLNCTMRLPFLSENFYHDLEGNIGAFDPAILNPILEPSMFVTVESGHVQEGHFQFKLDEEDAEGSMTVLYDNLEIELLSKRAGVRQPLGKEILSEVINWVAIKEENPDEPGEKPRVAQVRVSRDRKSSALSYWKDCLADGFLSSMGLKQQAKAL
ncbi:hypothetical protein CLV24_102208 [Pontibacter ummariensis]|uniref:DUF748 domain-containing protein n=1 Tax=Pontibacter ummariensis TaxID=1610492 RepID=A0A239BYF2_9BACT|nr:hypothetical protein [Pontibacter ummariensis]PRY15586.1 hypothetical protein CLV24_102208 [Pontibacter ummariensis]SNS12104.1 hypothetical protein SAMN06296052_102204 [Pontibacter ummariensis]